MSNLKAVILKGEHHIKDNGTCNVKIRITHSRKVVEYCLFPAEQQAEELIIVSHIDPSEELEKYINHFKNFISIPFSYIYFDTDREEIKKKI